VSAAAALARAEAAGVRFRLVPGGGVRMEAAAPPPPDVLADLRRWREDVAHLLAARDGLSARQPVPASEPLARLLHRAPPAAADWRSLPFGPERGEAFAAARLAPDACRRCAGRRWWRGEGAQAAPRCMTCHPPPPGLAFREMAT
jgi:hypothetical protein